jgi:hypothetical protein
MAALRLLRVLGHAPGELASAERTLREAGALTFRLIGATVR